MPDGHADPYLTATPDRSIANGTDNPLVCDEHGELITSSRLASPRRRPPPTRRARVRAGPIPLPVNDALAPTRHTERETIRWRA
jgi:hypothetical protein